MSVPNTKDFRFKPVCLQVKLSSNEKRLLMHFTDFLERHNYFSGKKSQMLFHLDMSILKRKEARPAFMKEQEQLCDQVLACLESKLSDVVREVGLLAGLLPFVLLYKVKSGAPEGGLHLDMGKLAPQDYATLIIPITDHASQGGTAFPLGEINFKKKEFEKAGGYHPVTGSYIFGGHIPHLQEANRSQFDRYAIVMSFTIEADDPSFGLPLSPFAERIRDEEICAAAAILVSLKNA